MRQTKEHSQTVSSVNAFIEHKKSILFLQPTSVMHTICAGPINYPCERILGETLFVHIFVVAAQTSSYSLEFVGTTPLKCSNLFVIPGERT